jgi:hypothetical protein
MAFGGLMFHGSLGFRMGTAMRMGPGYFPRVLALIMVVLGLISLARGLCVPGEKIDGVKWKSLLLILVSTALFGLLLERVGLALALVVLVLVSAIASKEFRFEWKALAGLAAFVVVCILVFVKLLGVPMPILGRWLEPIASFAPWLR